VVLGQLTAEALREARERAADVNEVLSGYRSGSEDLAGPGERRREYAPGVPLMQRYAAKAAERRVSVRTVKRWVAAAREGREAALAGEMPAREAGSGGLGRADPRLSGPVQGHWSDTFTNGALFCRPYLRRRAPRPRSPLPPQTALARAQERSSANAGFSTVKPSFTR
jgi:hypothetical protein